MNSSFTNKKKVINKEIENKTPSAIDNRLEQGRK